MEAIARRGGRVVRDAAQVDFEPYATAGERIRDIHVLKQYLVSWRGDARQRVELPVEQRQIRRWGLVWRAHGPGVCKRVGSPVAVIQQHRAVRRVPVNL